MTDPKLVEMAREITSKHLQRPDWIDIGYKDCFVCGTPLDKDEFNKRSASLVGEIAQALQSHGEEVRRKTVEEMYISLSKLPNLKHAHYTNIVVRINGEDKVFEADWLKEIQGAYNA